MVSKEELDSFEEEVLGVDVVIPAVELVEASSLSVDGNNPNVMSEDKKKALMNNLKKFGFIVPIICNKDGVIADGQHRWEVARDMGLKKVPVVLLDVDEVDRRILRQVLNKLRGEHAFDLDWKEFDYIYKNDGTESLADLLGEDADSFIRKNWDEQEEDSNVNEDYKGFKDSDVFVEEGDLWEVNGHKIICGNSTNSDVYKELLGEEKVKVVFTSPPYNMNGDMYESYDDDLESKEYIDFNLDVIDKIKPYLSGFLFWNLSYNKNSRWEFIEILHSIVSKAGLKFLELIVWNKKTALPIVSKEMLTRTYEDILLVGDEDSVMQDLEVYYLGRNDREAWFNKVSQKNITNYWELKPNGVQVDENIACFPVGVPKKGIMLMSKAGDIVLDPFGGTGTTLVACEQTKRKGRMIELDKKMCSIAIKRLEKLTGKKGVKVNQ